MQFNKAIFYAHLVNSYMKLGKLNGFTNNLGHSQVSEKDNNTKIDFGKWILLQHLVIIGADGMKSDNQPLHSKGSIIAYLANEIESRKQSLNNEIGAASDSRSYQESIEYAIKLGAIEALDELKSYVLTKK